MWNTDERQGNQRKGRMKMMRKTGVNGGGMTARRDYGKMSSRKHRTQKILKQVKRKLKDKE